MNTITKEKLEKYFDITKRALEKVKDKFDESRKKKAVTIKENEVSDFFGRITEDGNVEVIADDGSKVNRILIDNLYPVGSDLSSRYDHAEGIVLTKADAKRI